MRLALTVTLICLGLAGCFGSSGVPTDITDVRAALKANLNKLATAIEREDPLLASQIVSERFVMDNNVAVRYFDEGWNEQWVGIGKFREFFAGVFEVHANTEQSFDLRDLELVGTVATGRVYNEFTSSRTDRVPPEGYTAAGWDWFIFELAGTSWVLIRWGEAPPPPHDMGEGGEL